MTSAPQEAEAVGFKGIRCIMIRSNLPLPFLYRLRLQAGSAAKRAQSAPYRERGTAGRPTPGARPVAARRGAAGDAAQLWEDFVAQYEQFTGVLCAAAQYGCTDARESEYAGLRRWFVMHYYRVSPRVRPYLEAEFASDAPQIAVADYAGQKRILDALEALFVPLSLRDVLKHDEGGLIPRIVRLSETIYRCHDEWERQQGA